MAKQQNNITDVTGRLSRNLSLVKFATRFVHFLTLFIPTLTPLFQIRMHPLRLRPDHGVHLADSHSGGDSEKVHQPHLLHPLLPKPLHCLALGGHGRGLSGHDAVHRGVEQHAGGSAWTRRQGQESGVKKEEGLVVELKRQPLC